ncbi:MAG: flagellar export chaperone FliS [bacterium]
MSYLKSYRESEVASADGTRLIVMAYDGAIGFLRRARLAIAEERPAEALSHVLRAEKIVLHLMASVNPAAGEMAQNLTRLYSYVVERLGKIANTPEADAIDDALRVLEQLRDAWEQLAVQAQKKSVEAGHTPRVGDLSVCA